ncbi:hypothetical protein ACIA6D_40665 [Streptomyces cacaoi]
MKRKLLEGEQMEECAELSADIILRSTPGARVTRQTAVRRILRSMFRDIGEADREKYRNNILRLLDRRLAALWWWGREPQEPRP